MNFDKLLVKKILEEPESYEWSLQGMGMLRLYLSPQTRLHVWDSRYRVEYVSMLHNHPWDFTSYVIAGQITNHIFAEVDDEWEDKIYRFNKQRIRCGVGGGLVQESHAVRLGKVSAITYIADTTYCEKAREIHYSNPIDGTVTIIERTVPKHFDPDFADVFFEEGTEWVSAEPRPADVNEVIDICNRSLERWF